MTDREKLQDAHKCILEAYSALINIRYNDPKQEMYEAIRKATDAIERRTKEALGRMEGEA